MKNFTDICKMTQTEVKEYARKFLISEKYSPVVEDGFVYAKGDVPVLLVAHMDTVHKQLCTDIVDQNGRISSPQGIGGDDRCGIFMIMNIISELHCSVLFCEDEEVGGVGARKFTKSSVIDDVNVNYIIEFDRKGNNDAVFYDCDNKEFEDFVCDNTGLKKNFGTFSDISVLAPALKTAAVNISCGYYNAHTVSEYVVYDEMMDIIDCAKSLIKTESDKFIYIRKEYRYSGSCSSYKDGWYDQASLFDSKFLQSMKEDNQIELEVVWLDKEEENVGYGHGMTKAEAWFDFFMSNPEVSVSMIEDYSVN